MFQFVYRTWSLLRQRVVGEVRSFKEPGFPSWRDVLLRLPLLAFFVVLPIAVMLLLRAKPVAGLAVALDSVTFLGAMLGAQAAITALTLAVMLFVMQGVSTRRDVDDRIYAEYIRRSQVWPVFVGSITAVAVTGGVLIVERLVGDVGTVAQDVPGIPNLALLAVVSLAVSLAAPVVLFARAIKLAEPEHWQSLRLGVNQREVSDAVSAFLGRVRRADLSILFPGPGERSADQAIRALLDDALRAMDERRHGELSRSLDSIKKLVSCAMDEIENAGVHWGGPGSDAQWPPLMELGRNLYSYREEVIRGGNREYLDELLDLDYWFVSTGLRRPCGELFTFGLNGYRWNYEISSRVGSQDFHGLIRDRFLLNLDGLTFGHEPEALLPFMLEIIRHHGNVLSHALHANLVEDYRWLQREFSSILSDILERWYMDVGFSGDQPQLASHLTQENRVTLMGLAGRAVMLADSGEIADATPYVDVVRVAYGNPTSLGGDISSALRFERRATHRQWEDWEVPEHIGVWSGTLSPERYPLTCFAILLMELSDGATLDLHLGGNAKRILEWFRANSERLERFVVDTDSVTVHQRREFATAALHKAVERDEVEEDLEIIRREISSARVDAYRLDVSSGMVRAASVERFFGQVGAVLILDPGAKDAPAERGHRELLPKFCFVDGQESDHTYYAPISGEGGGRRLARDAVHLLSEAADGATRMTAPLDTRRAMFGAIDAALDELDPQGNAIVVLAGDSRDLLRDVHAQGMEEYEPPWQLAGQDPSVDMGRYRGYPILRGPDSGERRVYVVDLGMWGIFVRAPFEKGKDLHVDVQSISPERADELLQGHPDWFPEQPDHESKMRKLQTNVDVIVGVRHGFRVDDPSRARKIVADEPSAEADPDGSGTVSGFAVPGPLGAVIGEQDTPAVPC